MKANRLRNLKVTRVDLVDKGANYDVLTGEGAHVLLYKADETGAAKPKLKKDDGDDDVEMSCKKCGGDMNKSTKKCSKCSKAVDDTTDADDGDALKNTRKKMDLTKLDGEVRKFVEGLQTEIDTLKKAATEKKDDTDVLKGLNPEARILVEKSLAEAKSAREEVAKLIDASRSVEFAKRASAFTHLPSWTSENGGKLLKAVSEKAPELVAELETVLKAADEAIGTGALFSEAGRSGVDKSTTASGMVEAMISDKVSKKLAKDSVEAISQIMKERPDLYAKYRTEVQVHG